VEFQNTSVPDLVWEGVGERDSVRQAKREERVGEACGVNTRTLLQATAFSVIMATRAIF
jgi:hypothetical protein